MNSTLIPSKIIQQLYQVSEAHVSEIVSHVYDPCKSFDKELRSNSPIIHTLYFDDGSNGIKLMTNFTALKFEEIWNVIRVNVSVN